MAFKSESVNVKNEVYSCLHTVVSNGMSSVQRNYTANTYMSAKAREFTIDALLNTGKIRQKQEETRQVKRENKTADSQQSTLNEAENRYANDVMTPPKQQIYEPSSSDDMITYEAFSLGLRKGNLKYRRKHHSYLPLKLEERTNSLSNMHCQLPPAADVPYYSPMMSAGFFRPDECYSPMSFGGQGTPAGLKSYLNAPVPVENMQYQMNYNNLPTPTHSLTSTDRILTPTDEHNCSAGGRKIVPTRRQERPQPYLLTRQNFTTPDKSDTYLYITPDNDAHKTELTGKSVKGKRHRTAFTTEQLQTLETEFENQQYLVGNERCDLAESLNLTVSQVKVWFQNRRIKWRKEQFRQGNIQ